ncbi:unnamed protein product [Bemisia tabaci]|uniref:RING-type domain-containing protein n=1 Tax=Bemisia tabaci TaxID=7038 RepID=A0A9P0A7Y3_BEMTA|nr:PREDICTED: E3 ubiquitin-protein ligase RNF13 [Bemisia tabaci]XP_018899818.1 PREDICTED: E3 ubiquitin-protein ligase RNF13 [Bemisia tabaci]CAH0386094.1 unnamed protein product [Bemisia tabaci]
MYPDQWRQSAPIPVHITILYLISIIGSAIADVLVYSTLNRSYEDVDFRDAPSRFGGSIPFFDGIEGFVVYANPPNACQKIMGPPQYWDNYTGKWFVLISAEGCTFEQKIRWAQDANYDLAIVHNVNSSRVVPMTVDDPTGIEIPSTFISEEAGLRIRDDYQYLFHYTIIIDDSRFPFGWNTNLLIPFIIIVGFCFCPILGYIIVNFIKERRRAQRRRLPSSTLKKIPTEKFKKGSPYETCYICISDFVEGERVRLLLCSHVFHCECIDLWLTRYRRICPTCKRKVYSADEVQGTNVYLSDTDSESETDDRSPLIRSGTTQTQGGTFGLTEQEFRRSLIASLFRPMEQSSPTSSSYSNTSTCNEVPSTSNSHGSQQAATPFKHPFFAPMINSINSVDSIGTIPAAIATVPPYANRAHQSSSTEQPTSNSEEATVSDDTTVVPQGSSSQSDKPASGLVI